MVKAQKCENGQDAKNEKWSKRKNMKAVKTHKCENKKHPRTNKSNITFFLKQNSYPSNYQKFKVQCKVKKN